MAQAELRSTEPITTTDELTASFSTGISGYSFHLKKVETPKTPVVKKVEPNPIFWNNKEYI